MNEPLFRPEAVLASMGSRFGKAMFYQPLTVRLLVLASASAFLIFLAFAAWAQVKETRPVRGILTADSGATRIFADRAGFVLKVLVREGQRVKRGEILATLQDPQFTPTGERAASQMLGHLTRQKQQIKAQIRLARERAGLQETQLSSRLQILEQELLLLEQEHALTQQRLHLAQADHAAVLTLHDSGSVATSERNRSLTSLLSLQQVAISNQRNITAAQQKLQEVHQQLEMHPVMSEDEVLRLQQALGQLQTKDAELTNAAEFALIATVTGKVSNLLARAGDTVDPRSPVLALLPEDYTLQAELYLPSGTVGKVVPGQKIMLNYDAYPQEIYGSFSATLSHLSETTLDPREVLIPIPLQEPVYRALATLDTHAIDEAVLRPGLQFSAEIVTGRRSLLDRLLQPLQSLGRRL